VPPEGFEPSLMVPKTSVLSITPKGQNQIKNKKSKIKNKLAENEFHPTVFDI
jgi:hypothetical protein